MKKLLSMLLALLTTATCATSCSLINLGGLGASNPQSQTTDSSNSESANNITRLDMTNLAKNIDEVAKYDFSNDKVFGAAYYVYQDGVEFEKCYGAAALNSNRAITDTTIFRLASMTKPITTVATLLLAERQLLSLDEPIDTYLPEFSNIEIIDSSLNRTGVLNLPTIRNILNHTSGIGSDPDKLSSMTAQHKKTLDASVAFYKNNGLDFEPGTKQWYSGTGSFDVLTKIIEVVSGMDYPTFLKKEILDPCGMVDTTFEPTDAQKARMVAMHNRDEHGNTAYPMPEGCIFEDFPSTHYLGGAGLVSTLRDYSKFAKMLLNQGRTDDGKVILKETTFQQLCIPQVSKDIMPGNERWGLGVRVITEETYPYLPVGSFGWSGAYGSHFWIDPANQIFAVYMKNSKIDGGSANESAVNFEKAVYSSFETK